MRICSPAYPAASDYSTRFRGMQFYLLALFGPCCEKSSYSVSACRRRGLEGTLMVVHTSTGDSRRVACNSTDRPARKTITDDGAAMIPLPTRGNSGLADAPKNISSCWPFRQQTMAKHAAPALTVGGGGAAILRSNTRWDARARHHTMRIRIWEYGLHQL